MLPLGTIEKNPASNALVSRMYLQMDSNACQRTKTKNQITLELGISQLLPVAEGYNEGEYIIFHLHQDNWHKLGRTVLGR